MENGLPDLGTGGPKVCELGVPVIAPQKDAYFRLFNKTRGTLLLRVAVGIL